MNIRRSEPPKTIGIGLFAVMLSWGSWGCVDETSEAVQDEKPDIATQHQAVIGGTYSNRPEVVTVLAETYDPSTGALANWRCTGVLLTPRWVLTAHHCLEDLASGVWGDPNLIRIQTTGGSTVHAMATVPAPDPGTGPYIDIALIQLATPVEDPFPFHALYYGPGSALVGKQATCVGFAAECTRPANIDDWYPCRQEEAHGLEVIYQNGTHARLQDTGDADGENEEGDSGGPCYVEVSPGNYHIMGLWNAKFPDYAQVDITETWRSWVVDTINGSDDGGYCPKVFNDGGTPDVNENQFAVYAQTRLDLHDRVKVYDADRTSLADVASGPGTQAKPWQPKPETVLGADSQVGTVVSSNPVWLRNRAHVELLQTTAPITQSDQWEPLPPIDPTTPNLGGLHTLDWPTPGTENIEIFNRDAPPDVFASIPPGRYNTLMVRSGSRLYLSSGIYVFDNITIEPRAIVKYGQGSGPVVVYAGDLSWAGIGDGDAKDIMYIVGNAVTFSGFLGTLHNSTPYAMMNMSSDVHRGSLSGWFVDVHQGAIIEHVPSDCRRYR